MFIDALKEFLDSLGWRDIFHPGRVWDRAKAIFTAPIKRLIDFVRGLVVGILEMIKDAILKPLAGLASRDPRPGTCCSPCWAATRSPASP